ncbi:hypothetical protein N9Z41_00350 [bacterium]|nr:hypothetical protein [bacterium]
MARYYPKSQVKSNLYTKGKEYQYSNSQLEYKGYYYLTSQNQVYTGKHPGDLPNTLLVPIINIESQPFIDFQPPTPTKSTSWTCVGQGYNIDLTSPPTLPTSIYPNPQQNDYKLGEFERYFLSKTNEIKFIEVNKLIYNQYANQSPDVSYQLYTPFKLSWELTGDRKKVYEVNYKTVQRIERNFQLRGFVQYFKDRFDQFYKEVGS